MPVCHFCTPEEDHIGRTVVYILKVLEVCPKISAACLDYNSLLYKYLCVPGTTEPSERLFSKAGKVVAAKRSNIKPKNVDMILFLKIRMS